jgi:N-acetylglucosaminyl-diphospho-decaprenol L-rhamnosyltransferase
MARSPTNPRAPADDSRFDAVVVTYDSMLDLPGLLGCQPLREVFPRPIIVDNASDDASATLARAAGADVIQRSTNDGFGTAANEGVRRASGRFVCILNADIRLPTSDVVARLAQHFTDPSVAIVAPALVLPDGREQDSARQIPIPSDLLVRRLGRRDLGRVNPALPSSVPWVVGAFLLIRREAFDSVDGFDERFRLYFEDVDLCVRLHRLGWKVVFDPTVRVSHYHRASSRQSLTGWSTRQHILSALRFYVRYPRHLVLRRAPSKRIVSAAATLSRS